MRLLLIAIQPKSLRHDVGPREFDAVQLKSNSIALAVALVDQTQPVLPTLMGTPAFEHYARGPFFVSKG